MLYLTGAPAAFALALGFHEPTNGIAAPTTPTAPTAQVAPINTRRRVLFTASLLMTNSPLTALTASNRLTSPHNLKLRLIRSLATKDYWVTQEKAGNLNEFTLCLQE